MVIAPSLYTFTLDFFCLSVSGVFFMLFSLMYVFDYNYFYFIIAELSQLKN